MMARAPKMPIFTAERVIQMVAGAAVAFGGFQFGQGAQAEVVAEQGRKIQQLQANYSKIQHDTATISERVARVEEQVKRVDEKVDAQGVVQNQIFEMLRDVRDDTRR